jgi:hypothetical protein
MQKPRCVYCGKKPARLLIGEARPVFCSLRCAAQRSMETTLNLVWCKDCREWFNGMKEWGCHNGHTTDPS